MSTPIPLLASEVRPDSTMYGVKVTRDPGGGGEVIGTQINFDVSRFYFGVSPLASASDRQSALTMLENALNSSIGGDTLEVWSVRLSSTFKIIVSHTHATLSHRVTFYSSSGVSSAHMLLWGFQNYSNPTYLSYIDVAAATNVTADFKPRFLWTPGVPVHHTGPEGGFDPATDYGVPSSAGSIQRSQDGTVVAVDNGVLYDAEYEFIGVAGLYRIRPDPTLVYRNEDLDGWWQAGPAKGRRLLWWRNGQNAIGSDAPTGSGTPSLCIEYAPQEVLKNGFPARRMSDNGTYYWNVRFALHVTERADAIPGA